ncbi:MAG: hypothetical protein ABJG15_08155 [Hyphomonadaceae bacterium]
MLNAILSGKSGTLSQDLKKGTSWRTLFKGSEDLLTATVFERLSYLPDARFLEILADTFSFDIRAYGAGAIKLETIEFWPRWEDPTSHAYIVEPDVYMRFIFEECEQMIDVIIEAKPFDTGTLQYKTQWERQILSYAAMGNELDTPIASVTFLALGGLGADPRRMFSTLEKEFFESVDPKSLPQNLMMKGCSWRALLRVCESLKNLSSFETRVIADILESLSLSGYSKRYHFSDLKTSLSHQDLDVAMHRIKER